MTNQIKLTLNPGSSFLLGDVTVNPAYDSVTALDENNLPYLTATAIKGAIRIEFEALVRGIGEEKLCDFDTDIKGCTTCLSCRLFGGGNKEGKLRFNAAFLENPDEVLPLKVRQDLLEKGIREGVSISRTLGKAKEKAYFTKLAFPNMKKIKEISFTTGIDIRQELVETERKYLEMFLKYIERTGIFMGARKSVGLGYFTLRSEIPGKFEKPGPVDTSHQEMKLFRITLDTLEPLLVGNIKNRYIIDTLPYIPASTLGGTIGFQLKEYGVDDSLLKALFMEKKSFSTFNCYLETPYPVPMSQRKPKGKAGPVKDILVPEYILSQAIGQGKYGDAAPLFKALYKENNLRPVLICTQPETFYNAKVAIGRELQKSGESLLYSMELIPKGSKFQGFIAGEEWAVNALEQIGELRMGGKRTRGFGRTKITMEKADVKEIMDQETDLDSFLKEMAKEFSVEIPVDQRFFALDLISDFTLPEEVPAGNRVFKRYMEETLFKGMDIKIEKSFAGLTLRGGYDFKEKKSKPMMERIGAGSTFLVSVPLNKETDFLEKLRAITRNSEKHQWDSTLLFRLNNQEHIEIWR